VFPMSRKGLSRLRAVEDYLPVWHLGCRVSSPFAKIFCSTLHATGWKLLPPVAFANNSVPVLSDARVVYYTTRKVPRDIAVFSRHGVTPVCSHSQTLYVFLDSPDTLPELMLVIVVARLYLNFTSHQFFSLSLHQRFSSMLQHSVHRHISVSHIRLYLLINTTISDLTILEFILWTTNSRK
jgi:hypothetical protein